MEVTVAVSNQDVAMKILNCPTREKLPGWQRVRRQALNMTTNNNNHNHTNSLQTSKVICVCVKSCTAHIQLDSPLGSRWSFASIHILCVCSLSEQIFQIPCGILSCDLSCVGV